MDPPRWLLIAFISILLLLFPQVQTDLDVEKHIFGPFNSTDINTDFVAMGMTSINFGALQMNPVVSKVPVLITFKSGRVFFKKPFRLWEHDNLNESVASFNSSFLFNMLRVDNATPGEGFAFLISPTLSFPLHGNGKYLGLTDDITDGNTTNQIVAIELDTMKQEFDPDDNHIGLNINSVRSEVTVPLSQFGFQLSPSPNDTTTTTFYVVWVEYNGANKFIKVYMAVQPDKDGAIVEKPIQPLLSFDLDLRRFVNQSSYFGFSSSTGDTFEMITILRWNLSVENILTESKVATKSEDERQRYHHGWLKIDLGIALGVGLALLMVGIVYWRFREKRKSGSDPRILSTIKKLPGSPREFTLRELKKATNNFDEKVKLGQGGFGQVYRGTLPKEKMEVAVKKFSREKMKSTDDFLAELTIINRLRHKNLVPLLGWCYKNKILLLVYEYMPNGSLDKHIFCKKETCTAPLSWHLRYKIILGVASALHYLHNEYDQKVIHRDLKASNIMLDSDFNARLGDFGLARALENEKTSYGELEGVHGTMGYIAPECLHTGKATCNSDVYGFGVVLLEVVCGQRPRTMIEDYVLLVDWVWHLHREKRILEAVDQRLGNDYVVEEVERILKLGLACSNPIASERPKMQTVIQIISGSVAVPHLPTFKPTFVWPATVNVGSSVRDPTTILTIDHTPINTVCFAR